MSHIYSNVNSVLLNNRKYVTVTPQESLNESCEMLKALYDFKATFAKTLSFKENDLFILHQISTKQRNWWQVVNARAQVGYVPSNYVCTIQVSPEFWIQFLDGCLEVLRNEGAQGGGCLAPDRQDLLRILVERRQKGERLLSGSMKEYAPLPPEFQVSSTPVHVPYLADSYSKSSTSYVTAVSSSEVQMPLINSPHHTTFSKQKHKPGRKSTKHVIHLTSSDSQFTSNSTENQNEEPKKSYSVNSIAPSSEKAKDPSESGSDPGSEAAYQLVEQVRKHTQLSHEMSRVAVSVVVSSLSELLPSSCIPKLTAILNHLQGPLAASEPLIEETHDARRLKVIFTELTSCKEDSQQRSWMLYEDEATIMEYIKELTSILTNADANISRHVMATDQYHGVSTLVQYYQMETRWSIRQLLLQAFGIMCSLHSTVVTLMLNSILPMELARDMRSNPRHIPRLNYSALLLTMIFSMGEPMPVTHLEHLGVDFITFLFDLIESPPDTDVEEQIPDLFLNLVLSYNLQFSSSTENIMLKALLQRSMAKTLTEKVLLLLNREEDPVRIFEHQPAPPHSVVKLFVDLFSNEKTAALFYTNDTKVLIDIIVRQLADLSPGDPRRHQYLELCRLVMRNTPYSEHHHRRDDILKCFTRIFCEESEQSRPDQQLVREISNEFPQYFKA